LPPDELDRIFDRFYRGTGTAPNQFSSGMGLAITRGLLAIQGGQIRADNHPDGGAVFTLKVPAASRVVAEAEAEA
jgi:signal transduction histidine kinase